MKWTFSGNFCKRLNTFDNFHQKWSPTWGGRVIWHPKDTKSGPPPGVAKSSGTLRTPKAVPHLDFRSISCRFPIGFRTISIKNCRNTHFGISFTWIKNRPSSGILGMDQKSTIFGVPWHGSKIDRFRGKGSRRFSEPRTGCRAIQVRFSEPRTGTEPRTGGFRPNRFAGSTSNRLTPPATIFMVPVILQSPHALVSFCHGQRPHM